MRSLLGKTHTIRGRGDGTNSPSPAPSSSADIFVELPRLAIKDWACVDVAVVTGLAPDGSIVRAVLPGGLRNWIRCDARVVRTNCVRLRAENIGAREFPGGAYPVRFYPSGRRKSLMPEIKFDLPEILI